MEKTNLLYTTSHEWLAVDGDVVTVGITEFAVKSLTDLVFIDLPQVGRAAAAGESFGEIESVKAVSDLLAPVTGEIVGVNDALVDNLEILNSDPYDKGWMVRIKMTSPLPTGLLDFKTYQQQCSEHGA
ncbi:MAG: glycine cleavage system protein GcvH [Planctomycetaceae bacterium]|jgi:glycine cleavage system H protein|nr:glycine cleavage system protein GcvH [Planctomycetaceae bacterium]